MFYSSEINSLVKLSLKSKAYVTLVQENMQRPHSADLFESVLKILGPFFDDFFGTADFQNNQYLEFKGLK